LRILVTGAAGFLGHHTARALISNGHDVTLVDNHSRHGDTDVFSELSQNPNVKVHELDLRQEANWEKLGNGLDVILHLAAINGTRNFYERPYTVLDTNIELVRQCLSWHRRRNPQAYIVWTSSSEVYAGVSGIQIPTPEDTPVGIDDVTNARYSYGVSKLAGELLLINAARAYDVPYTIVRPHNIYGPGMGYDHVIPEFIMRACRRENPFSIFGGDTTRAFCYVDDFVQGLLLILQTKSAIGEIINLGDDRQELTMRQLASLLFALVEWEPEIDVHPAPAGSTPRRRPSLEKARRLLRFEPTVPLEVGLRLTYEWYRDNQR